MGLNSHRQLPCYLCLTCGILALALILDARIILDPVSVLYIPYDYDGTTGEGLYKIAGGASEQSSYDSKHHILYIAGDHFLHIVNVSDATRPAIVDYFEIDSLANDIEVCGDTVGYVQNGLAHHNAPGWLRLYHLYDTTSGNWTKRFDIQVGSVPDMLYFTKDCRTIVVVNEAEYGHTEDPTVFIDPEGSVSIIRLDPTLDQGYTINHLNFTRFNEMADEYEARGVRYPYKNSTFSQNLEPEYVTFNSDDTRAYVSLQENNAVAVIDLVKETVVDLYALGSKSWKNLRLDASDKDGEISFRSYDIYSFYQPDALRYFEVDGTGYIVTANEGSSIEYPTWSEEKRGKALVEDGLVWGEIQPELLSALNDTSKLGRLKFTQYDGVNASRFNKLDRLHFFGGRSITIRRADDLTLVYDTGDEVEVQTSKLVKDVFNGDTKPNFATPAETSDKRSDDYGPECESLAFGELDGTRVLFVGVERLSAILMFTFASGSPIPVFDGVYRAGGSNRSFDQLLEDRNLGDLDPEDIKFLPGEKSPTGSPFLIVTNNVAGTIAFYNVTSKDDTPMTTPTSRATNQNPHPFAHVAAMAVVYLLINEINSRVITSI